MILPHVGAGCPLCGVAHAACGQPATSQPVDIPIMTTEDAAMSVRKYRVTVRGTETIMRLNDRDLEQYPDAQPVDDKTPTGPTTGEPTRASGKTRAAGNKARDAAADKASG